MGELSRLAEIEVLIVDDYKLFAEALEAALGDVGINVVDVTVSGATGIQAARRLRPDLVLVDLGLPDINGLDVGREIVRELPATKVVLLTGLKYRELAREALQSGLHGFLTKETGLSQLVKAIVAVVNGQAILPRPVAAVAVAPLSPEEEYWALLSKQLTHRERQVLGLLVKGASSSEIASRLDIMPNTVRTHIQNVLTKLQVHSRLEAAALATRASLVPGSQQTSPFPQ